MHLHMVVINLEDNSGEYIKRKDVERMEILLNATLEILEKCEQGIYVKNVFEETAFYDGVDCDGFCLKEDIKMLLNPEEY